MKRATRISAAVCAAVATAACASVSTQGSDALLDGGRPASMQNWARVGDANWRAVDGAIVADKGSVDSFLVSRTPYGDFQITAEFWAESNTNSGIFIRCTDTKAISPATCYEVNIWDTRPDPAYGTGAIVDVAKVSPTPSAAGRWSTMVITAQGPHLVVELNGVKTVDVNDAKFASGPFALQWGLVPNDRPGGPIKFRKVSIKPL